MNSILSSILPVIQNSQYVTYNIQAAQHFVDKLKSAKVEIPQWNLQYHYYDASPRTVTYVLILDSLNFSFWGKPRWTIEYEGEKLNGYFALAASLKRAFTKGIPLDDPDYLTHISEQELGDILKGNHTIPLLKERTAILHEIGTILIQHFNAKGTVLVEQANRSVQELLKILIYYFPNFRDEVDYNGHRVYFYKRAQIFCADLWGTFSGKNWGEFHDINQLTAFADYKLPQVLRSLGILKYDLTLAKKVDHQNEIPSCSKEEVEIRAFTLYAVEEIKKIFSTLGVHYNSMQIDWLLWQMGQGIKTMPYHHTRTIFY